MPWAEDSFLFLFSQLCVLPCCVRGMHYLDLILTTVHQSLVSLLDFAIYQRTASGLISLQCLPIAIIPLTCHQDISQIDINMPGLGFRFFFLPKVLA